ncbi:hypothetical protein ACTXT7_014918 [Hymenolepis weldensis]
MPKQPEYKLSSCGYYQEALSKSRIPRWLNLLIMIILAAPETRNEEVNTNDNGYDCIHPDIQQRAALDNIIKFN